MQALIEIEGRIVVTDILTERFCCDLAACRGMCCVEGNAGAPLEKEELAVLEREYERFSPYMTEEGRQAVAQQGFFVIDGDGDYTTPLIGDADCAYACRENGTTLCAIEKAWREGRTAFRKPRHEVQRRQRRTALPPLGYLCTGSSIRQENGNTRL